MSRALASVILAIAVAVAVVFISPVTWFTWVFGAAIASCLVFAIIVRVDTKTARPVSPVAGFVLLALNLPEQPLAKVAISWALTSFFVSAAFAISLGLAAIVRAYA